jgi:Flp pilus assembly protein TadD
MAKALGTTVWLLVLLLSLAACATRPAARPSASQLPTADLLSGAALFGTGPGLRAVPADDVFRLDDDMRAFVATELNGARTTETALRRLLAGMHARGMESFDYSGLTTRTVRETFHGREGNCLSFTMLFVALAREAGLRVDYQIVSMPPTWSSVDDNVVLSSHINTIIQGVSREYYVDFNLIEFNQNYPRRIVDDAHALALFYSNVGAEALIAEDYARSFVYFREAIRTDPDNPAPWINLGLLYARHDLHDEAEAAYLHGLERDPGNGSALTNLTALYATVGDRASVALYRARIERYQQRNPYYHYTRAQQAFEAGRFVDTLALLGKAIRLERTEHRFHSLMGQTYLELAQLGDAERSFRRARDLASADDLRRMYESKLELLTRR